MIDHARFALSMLPPRPEELDREHLPSLLAAVQGQQALIGAHREGLITALAEGNRDALSALLAEQGEMQVATEVLTPYRRQAERMARGAK
jgi:hypothetical protein